MARWAGCALALLLGALPARGQGLDLPVSPRVDTTRAEIAEVHRLWRAYLSARPDSIRPNPYWSEAEQTRYGDFDLSRRWTYGYVTGGFRVHDGLRIRPRVLSIEPDPQAGGAYSIRTLYAPDDLDGFQGLFSVQRIYAHPEGGAWRLSNALPVLTRSWARRRAGLIEYVAPPEHVFNEAAVRRAATFADSVASRFGLRADRPVEYYVAPTASEMARILGLDYSWDPNDGRAYPENRQVFVGTGREDYLHEIVHALFGPLDAVPLLSEGLATYLGGFGDQPFAQAAAAAAESLREHPALAFADVLGGQVPSAQLLYVSGAALVEAVLGHGGPDALRRFLAVGTTPEGVYAGLAEVLGVPRAEADAFWRSRLRAHARAPHPGPAR